jgi:hypothetical protein
MSPLGDYKTLKRKCKDCGKPLDNWFPVYPKRLCDSCWFEENNLSEKAEEIHPDDNPFNVNRPRDGEYTG